MSEPKWWQIVDDSIECYRPAIAHAIGTSVDTIALWCLPPAGFTPATAGGRGRHNPLSDLHKIATLCPNGMHAVQQLVDALDCILIPKDQPAEPGQLPIATPALLRDAWDKLDAELRRRKPRLRPQELRDLRDGLIASLYAASERIIERRAK